jgi:hypothetical protein
MAPDEYKVALRTKLAEAILTTGREGPGHPTIVFSAEAVDELLCIIALVIHNSAEVDTPSKSRKFCDEIARKLQKRISEMQRLAAEGGMDFLFARPAGPLS